MVARFSLEKSAASQSFKLLFWPNHFDLPSPDGCALSGCLRQSIFGVPTPPVAGAFFVRRWNTAIPQCGMPTICNFRRCTRHQMRPMKTFAKIAMCIMVILLAILVAGWGATERT